MYSKLYSHAGFLQFEITFGDPSANMEKAGSMLLRLNPRPGSIIILPELWASGFDYFHAQEIAEQTPGLLSKLKKLARDNSIFLGGSLIEMEKRADADVSLYNTFFLVGPEGVVGTYRKVHLFGLWQEDRYFDRGELQGPIETPSGPVGALICYDLRFPDIAQRQCFAGAELIVVSAQWPKVRLAHWQTLLRARAIENQVFIAACNGCGMTGEHALGGHSMIIGPDGTVLAEAGDVAEAHTVELVPGDLQRVRSRFCSLADRPYPLNSGNKILSLIELQERLKPARDQGSKVAFTNGCFDILHSGHVSYLEQARKTADCLVVGLNSDSSVRRLKGNDRPINDEDNRARVLAALGCVDYVILFSEDTPINLITNLMPDVLVKGADWPEDRIVGAQEVKNAGGSVVRVKFEHELSTSSVISRIQKLLDT